MKVALLELLRCPECLGTLSVDAWRCRGGASGYAEASADRRSLGGGWSAAPGAEEIEDGQLQCEGCRRTFPIINSIPRLLPDVLAAQTLAYHRGFFERYSTQTAAFRARAGGTNGDASDWWAAEQRTIRSYSYQWRKFKQMFPHWEEVFRESIAPVQPEFFAGKIGLDGGCGFGRSLVYAASYGATVVGLDLSEAIEAARENTRNLSGVHLVQGDIFHPPIARRSLDFVYSIGVLHHLPDPKGGFVSLSRLLKPGAPIVIWVYLRKRGRQIKAFAAMRAVSTRLPLRTLNVVCLALAVAQFTMFIGPRRLLESIGARALARRVPFSLYAKYPFRALHTDWFDGLSVPLVNYYKPHEIAEWYRAAGLAHVRIGSEAEWNGRAIGYAPVVEQPVAARV